ncbi:MAG: TlpA disulfide reductase family protein [Dokdonella sp.]
MPTSFRLILPQIGLPLVISLLVACSPQPASDPATAATPPPAATTVPATQADTQVRAPEPKDQTTPVLEVTTFDGRPWSLRKQRGHWVLVNFWATWCGPCLEEMPALSAFNTKREDVSVIGLAFDDIDHAGMQDFLKQHTVSYPIAMIDTLHPPQDFDTPRGLPTSYLIAPDGSVAKKIIGPLKIQVLEQAIAAATVLTLPKK